MRAAPKVKWKLGVEHVLGTTVTDRCKLATSSTGETAFAAGCIAVVHHAATQEQVAFLRTKAGNPVASLAFSPTGKYLAVGESGRQPAIVVWRWAASVQVVTLRRHKYAVAQVCWSPDERYLLSLGHAQDPTLFLWLWKKAYTVAVAVVKPPKVSAMAFSPDGSFFVTAGLRCVKFWPMADVEKFVEKQQAYVGNAVVDAAAGDAHLLTTLDGKAALLTAALRDAAFVDVHCVALGARVHVLALTGAGVLCSFLPSRVMDKYVDVRCGPQPTGLCVGPRYVGCSGARGLVRLFSTAGLGYIATLPRPPLAGAESVGPAASNETFSEKAPDEDFPDCTALQFVNDGGFVVCCFADRSLVVWDISEPTRAQLVACRQHHSQIIWDVGLCPEPGPLPADTVATCSADGTVRFWALGLGPEETGAAPPHLQHTIRILCEEGEVGGSAAKAPGDQGLRSLCVSPDGGVLMAGDRRGNVHLYSLHSWEKVGEVAAHAAEVLCLDSALDLRTGRCFVASGSRDRCIHLFDVDRNQLLQTVDDHTA
eukprot:EG_transcript_9153